MKYGLIAGFLISISASVLADSLSPASIAVTPSNWRQDVANLHQAGGIIELPAPQTTPHKPLTLSLREAILLSLRNNPDIQSTELNRITDKFSVVLAHHFFEPQYTLDASASVADDGHPVYTSHAGVTLNNRIGTQFGLDYFRTDGTDDSGLGQTAFTITQPLLKGFGSEVNTITWFDSLDSENQARLSFKSSMMSQVVSVIESYRQLVEDYQNLDIQQRTLKASAETVRQSSLKYKVGRLAQSDLLQQQANYQTTQLALLNQKSSLISDYQNFLQLLGLKSSAKVAIDKKPEKRPMKIPSLQKAIDAALQGNVSYQQTLIGIKAAERAVVSANDAARWQLDLSSRFNLSDQGGPVFVSDDGATTIQQYALQDSLEASLKLSIPLDNVANEQAIVSAEIALQQYRLSLESAKLSLVSQITNEVAQINNQQKTLAAAQNQVEFQRQSYRAAKINYQYGRATAFELNQIQNQLLAQEISLVNHRIYLLNQVTHLNQDLGLTLDNWDIHLRY